MDTPPPDDELDRLRAEVAEWRRRAEMAEAVSVERLARAETAEMALEAARSALRVGGPPAPASSSARRTPTVAGRPKTATGAQADERATAPPARSLRERWRRYIESVN